MQIIKAADGKADIQFSFDELMTLNDSLNEVCHGIEVIDFETKIGVSREQAKILLDSVHELINDLRPPHQANRTLQTRTNKSNSSSTIKERCILETSGYQVTFFIRSLDDCKRAVGIGVTLTVNPALGGVSVRSTVTRMMIPTLQTLISYLEQHINNLKEDPNKTSDLHYYHIFQIQALSGTFTSEDEGSFILRFMVNVKDKENQSPHVGAQAAVTFANVRSFTSSLQAVLNQLSYSS